MPRWPTGNTLYYPGDGGTVYERGSLNSPGSVTPTQEAFYGSLSTYEANAAAYNAGVAISTPITADAEGDIYFGYQTSNSAPGGLTNGIARISAGGVGSFFEADQLKVGGVSAGMTQVATNSAPAVTPSGSTVYVAMSDGNFGTGRLVALNTATMTPTASVALLDPKTGGGALVPNDGTASPMIGPDGDVYMGVYDDYGTSRGWMEHYSANLSVTKPAGGFGWDDTASIVPASMVPSYHGTSSYLIMTKYNNYADPGTGGNGQNMIAILDPNATETDTRYNSNGAGGATIMQVVESVLGPTPDPNFDQQYPGAVHEWCINTAAVDPATDSVIVNSEDGNLYRWNLATDTLTQQITITSGLGEAYTPTEIGPDGTAYAINNATLFAVGAPDSSSQVYATWASSGGGSWSNGTDWTLNPPGNAGDTASFGITNSAPTLITLDGDRSLGTMNFSSAYSYTIAQGSGGSLTLDNGASAAQINDYNGNHTISAPVVLNSNTTIAVAQSGNVFTISGNISGAGGITLAATSALNAGTVVLSGSNSYRGGTTVTSGTLIIGANGGAAHQSSRRDHRRQAATGPEHRRRNGLVAFDHRRRQRQPDEQSHRYRLWQRRRSSDGGFKRSGIHHLRRDLQFPGQRFLRSRLGRRQRRVRIRNRRRQQRIGCLRTARRRQSRRLGHRHRFYHPGWQPRQVVPGGRAAGELGGW